MKYDTIDTKQAENSKYRTNTGEPTLDIYEYKVDKEGVRELVKTDRKENVYARIQADYDATDINKLMARFALGDSSALDQRDGFYGDATKLPSTYAEMFDRVEECKRFFNSLPVDLKQSFGNSYEMFFASYGTDEFNKKFDEYNERFKNHQYEVSNEASTSVEKAEYMEVER